VRGKDELELELEDEDECFVLEDGAAVLETGALARV